MDTGKVLLFDGLRNPRKKGGYGMFGKRCVRTKRVYSPVLGRNVQRCAQFSGGGLGGFGQLGAFPISLDAIKDAGMTAGVAVGSAVGVRRLTDWWIRYLNLDPNTERWARPIAEVATGVGGSYLIGKYAGKTDIAAAVMLGPMVVNGMELVGGLIAPAPVAGYGYSYNQPSLGAVVEQDQLTPGWATGDPFLSQVQQQFPAWGMG